ncbi:acyl-(acyl carrier protein)--UDP-N-acetylglucosamine/UDP-2-N-acetylglucose-2,3-diamine 3-O/N-acyltransferase [Syntrophotalea carbinolica DSM 2380]|uniref:Acyl-[acyl-carrier-protein]--UDP-N-acetylglucosamine O-acyltransferase n=1 Tax=Syntrophotalea carbinolica (strain DSM 2380 / NBRC 103641 / GraBd1) TaxID=338963 RepID=Q3A553_SYNC1|nr:acyl-ACP--UDP-N-acetylglucosamine O-acyltransferase [Syntrophotalea carbinolica]ABA88504.1 acyl-(acyl carrier protein)--UDP-N-acetylglucosamine/UDP-2-N-acetylglucose-2,3-diamine 3-O/N-acyltransferase [Syntrophotalea carbinolica DSM 2380]
MIHATAIIHDGARIEDGVEIGPYAVIGPHVSIAAGTSVGAHAVIEGWTDIGRDNRIFQFTSIGADPQDLKFHGEQSSLRIGDRNTIREFVTMHRGTEDGGLETVVGDDNLFMAYTHVAHDCIIGNRVILANGATLGGHVRVDDWAILGGLSAIHQFTRVGCHAMISGGSMVTQDIAPYIIAQGDRAKAAGINLVGLKRRGFSDEILRDIKQAYKLMFRSNLRQEQALDRISAEISDAPEIKAFVDFIRTSERGVAR